MKNFGLVYLTEDASHDAVIELINEEAFGPGRHTRAAARIREQGPHDRALSYICADNGETIASVRMTPVMAGGVKGHLLGPLAVDPAHEGKGIGANLMRAAIFEARRLGHGAILLVGDAPYYERFGFFADKTSTLMMPGPFERARFLALELEDGWLKGAAGLLVACGRKLSLAPVKKAA